MCPLMRPFIFAWMHSIIKSQSDISHPKINERLLRKLLLKAMRDVEFSFDNSMYRQKYGVAIIRGSPLGIGTCASQHFPWFLRVTDSG